MTQPLHVAVDAGAVGGRNGVARYLAALLPRMIEAGAGGFVWSLYGRDLRTLADAGFGQVSRRGDRLPRDLGRIVSLFTSQPRWSRVDRPDLFWGPAHRLPAWLPERTARVVTIHDLCWLEVPETMRAVTRGLDRWLMPRALRQADRAIAVSRSTRDAIVGAFPEVAPRVRIVHEACESMPAPGERPVAEPYVLAVGTVEPRKNLARLFEAFARVPGPTRLVLAGGRGWGTQAPEAMAARAGIAERFTWLGGVDDRTLSTLYRHAALLAMPSLYEGFGLPILEALSHGTPVLHGDASSMPEVAGEAGLAVDARSVDSIAEGLARMLGDERLRETLAARAAAQAAKFSWGRAARETLAVFEEAVAARRARQR